LVQGNGLPSLGRLIIRCKPKRSK